MCVCVSVCVCFGNIQVCTQTQISRVLSMSHLIIDPPVVLGINMEVFLLIRDNLHCTGLIPHTVMSAEDGWMRTTHTHIRVRDG